MNTQHQPRESSRTKLCSICPKPAVTVERCGKSLCAEHATLLRTLTSRALDANLELAS
jgi:hypothetical protein